MEWNTTEAKKDIIPNDGSLIDQCHAIMDKGAMNVCNSHITKGECCCCVFDKKLGNWISLLPDEKEYISQGDVEKWIFEKHDDLDTVMCERGGHHCSNKPLDCKLYPYFPESVEDTPTGYNVTLIVGFPKCPLHNDRKNEDLIDLEDRVAKVGILLHKNGLDEWMQKSADNYKGYDEKLFVSIIKDKS